MKRFLLLCMSCFLLVSFSACGKTEKINDESTAAGIEENKVLEKQKEKNNARVSQNTEEKNVENAESFTGENNTEENTGNEETPAENTEGNTNVSLDEDTDTYVGEYDSYDIYKPLEIAKNEDGTYIIQIQIYPLITLYKCVGEATDEGIAFSTTECAGKDYSGIITFEGNDADVKFTSSDWAELVEITEFKYHKTSDAPNIYMPDFLSNPDNDTDIYVGEYNSYDVDEPDLEIAKNEDGTYAIQIGMYRLVQLDQCVGEATNEGIAFSTTEWDGKDFSGLITVEGNDAIVRFTSSDWAEFTDIDIVYRYYKISGVPNIKDEN